MDSMQSLIVALLVPGCSAYVVWVVLPGAARRGAVDALLRLPLPDVLAARLRKTAQATSGCGCSGCDHAVSKPGPDAAQTITFHPRARR